MVFTQEPDKLITCPLDESHRILQSRMQFHLVRCLKNHKLTNLVRCPWNPLHIIDKYAYVDHYSVTCENIPGALAFLFPTEPPRDVGSVPVGAVNAVLPATAEDWDADPTPVGTYDPSAYVEKNQLLRQSVGLSKAKRKAYRESERKRFQQIEETLPIQAKAPPPLPTLREPHKRNRSISANTTLINDSSIFSDDDKKTSKNWMQASKETKVHSTSTHSSDIPRKENGAYPKQMIAANDRSISSNDDDNDNNEKFKLLDKMPNLCQMTEPKSSYTNIIPSVGNSLPQYSDVGSYGLDEAASLPKLIVEDDEEFIKRLAELDLKQKKIDKERENTYREFMERKTMPKLVNSNSSFVHNNLLDSNRGNGASKIKDDYSSPPSSISSYFGMPNCAASFPKLSNNRRPPGIGRGMVIMDLSSRNSLSGQTQEFVDPAIDTTQSSIANTSYNPFRNGNIFAADDTSQLNYNLGDNNDEDSVYEYNGRN